MQSIPKGIDKFKKIADITRYQGRIHIESVEAGKLKQLNRLGFSIGV